MPAYYGDYVPNMGELKQGDVIFFGKNTTFQSPQIQELAKQNAITNYQGDKGVTILKPYTAPGNLPSPNLSSTNVNANATGTMNSMGDTPAPTMDGYSGNLEQDIAGAQNYVPPYLQDAQTQANGLLESQQVALDEQFAAAQQQIQQQTSGAIQGTQDTGGRVMGTLKRLLGRAGGFTTSAGGQAMVTQEQNVQNDINKLRAQESQLISQARAALTSGKAQLASASFDTLQKIQGDIQAAQDRRVGNMLDLFNSMEGQRQFNVTSSQQQSQFEQTESRIQEQFGKSLAFDEKQFSWQQAQDKITNVFQEAGLTGMYMGNPTFQAKQAEIDNALKREGLQIDWAQLQETQRSNMAREGIARYEAGIGVANEAGIQLSDNEQSVMSMLKQIEGEDGTMTWAVDGEMMMAAIDTLVPQKGTNRTDAYNKLQSAANSLADKMNTEGAASADSLDTGDMGVWGTGASTVGGATRKVYGEAVTLPYKAVGGLFGFLKNLILGE